MFKILVVEDDKELNRSVCTFLNQSGYEAAGCLNATDAYDAMYAATFDLMRFFQLGSRLPHQSQAVRSQTKFGFRNDLGNLSLVL